jgi:hypothetical protein
VLSLQVPCEAERRKLKRSAARTRLGIQVVVHIALTRSGEAQRVPRRLYRRVALSFVVRPATCAALAWRARSEQREPCVALRSACRFSRAPPSARVSARHSLPCALRCAAPCGRACRAPCAPAWRCWRWRLRLPARWRRVATQQCQTPRGCQPHCRRTLAARPAASARSSSSTTASSAATLCTANTRLRRAGRVGSACVSRLGCAPCCALALTLLPRAQDCPAECEVSWDMAREPEAAAGASLRKKQRKSACRAQRAQQRHSGGEI